MPPGLPDTVSIENEHLRVSMRPGLGAKVVSLLDRRTKREWLLPSQLPGGGYLQPAYGADFSRFDTSGLDECFPSVAESQHPGAPITWPDHGELWSRPWTVESAEAVKQPGGPPSFMSEGTLAACMEGRAWPYLFTRRASLEGESLRLDYTLENRADRPFVHLWSVHPLLNVAPGMRILLPEGLREAYVDWSSDPALGASGEWRSWPQLALGIDLSTVRPAVFGKAVKLYFRQVPEGFCGLLDPASGQALTLSWDLEAAPHLGLWLCYGGWPTDGRPGHLTVALEPCSGMPDRLAEAAARGTSATLGPGETKRWSLRLRSHPHWTP